jgi:hypothetical protein
MKARAIPILMLLSGLFGSIVAMIARPHPQEKPDQLSEPEALGLMRTINTFQVAPFQGPRHQYVSLEELVAQPHEKAHNSVGIALSRVFGAESSRPASLLCTLRTHQSPGEWQHSLPACMLALAVRDLHPLDSSKRFHRLIFGSSSSTLFPAR